MTLWTPDQPIKNFFLEISESNMLMWTDFAIEQGWSEVVSVPKLPQLEYSNLFWFYIDWLNHYDLLFVEIEQEPGRPKNHDR